MRVESVNSLGEEALRPKQPFKSRLNVTPSNDSMKQTKKFNIKRHP